MRTSSLSLVVIASTLMFANAVVGESLGEIELSDADLLSIPHVAIRGVVVPSEERGLGKCFSASYLIRVSSVVRGELQRGQVIVVLVHRGFEPSRAGREQFVVAWPLSEGDLALCGADDDSLDLGTGPLFALSRTRVTAFDILPRGNGGCAKLMAKSCNGQAVFLSGEIAWSPAVELGVPHNCRAFSASEKRFEAALVRDREDGN